LNGYDEEEQSMKPDSEGSIPMIFLAGPPGAGKSGLGKKACQELKLRFFDLSTPVINEQSLLSQKEILTEVITKRSADIIALPFGCFNKTRGYEHWLDVPECYCSYGRIPLTCRLVQAIRSHFLPLLRGSKPGVDSGVTALGVVSFEAWIVLPMKS
jgi:hypothetical protein